MSAAANYRVSTGCSTEWSLDLGVGVDVGRGGTRGSRKHKMTRARALSGRTATARTYLNFASLFRFNNSFCTYVFHTE